MRKQPTSETGILNKTKRLAAEGRRLDRLGAELRLKKERLERAMAHYNAFLEKQNRLKPESVFGALKRALLGY